MADMDSNDSSRPQKTHRKTTRLAQQANGQNKDDEFLTRFGRTPRMMSLAYRSRLVMPLKELDCEVHAVQCYLAKFGHYQKFICVIVFFCTLFGWFSKSMFLVYITGARNCQYPKHTPLKCSIKCPVTDSDGNTLQRWDSENECVDLKAHLWGHMYGIFLLPFIFLFAYLADRFGRRVLFIYAMSIQLICCTVLRVSFNLPMRQAFAIIQIFAAESLNVIGLAIGMEIAGSRSHILLIVLNTIANSVNGPLSTLTFKYVDDFHTIITTMAVLSGVMVLATTLIPESPLWLFNENRLEEAAQIIAKLFKWDKQHTMPLELDKIRASVEKSWRIHRSCPKSTSQSIPNICYYHCLRKNFFIFLFFGISLGALYFVKPTANIENENLVLLADICTCALGLIIFVCTVKYLGHKKSLDWAVVALIIVLVVHAICLEINFNHDETIIGLLQRVSLYFTRSCYILYFMEYWPVAMRAKILALNHGTVSIGYVVMFEVVEVFTNVKWINQAILAICFVYILTNLNTFPETKGYALPSTLRDSELLTATQIMEKEIRNLREP